MEQVKIKMPRLNYYNLSILFVFIGTCLVFFPPIVPEDRLQALGEALFPLTPPGAAAVFLSFFQALGVEFYGGAILSFAFGKVEEGESLRRTEREEELTQHILSELKQLSQDISTLSSTLARDVRNSDDLSTQVRRNRWLWRFFFG